jgi:hypothetical protein
MYGRVDLAVIGPQQHCTICIVKGGGARRDKVKGKMDRVCGVCNADATTGTSLPVAGGITVQTSAEAVRRVVKDLRN